MIVRELLTRLGFTVDESGAEKYERSMSKIRTHAQTLQQNLGGILGAIGLGMSFAFFKDVTSQFTDLEARLANNLGADGASAAMSRLHDVALLTYQPTEQLIESFISMKSALDNLGLSTDQQIDLQQAISDGFTATGVKGEQASRALMWMNRAFTKNKVSLEEFNGILEAGGDDLLAMMAKDLGTTVGGLRDMASAGKITGKVLSDFFMKRMPEFRKQSEQMPVTINDAIGRVQEAFRWWTYETDKASEASQKIVPIIMWFADHIEVLAGVVISLLVPALMGLVVWIASTTAAFFGLAAALLANPLTWVVIGIGALVLAIQDLYTWIQGGDSLLGRWLGPWKDVLAQMTAAWNEFTAPFSSFLDHLQALMRAPDLATAWSALLGMLADLWQIFWSITLPGMLGLSVTDLFAPLKTAWESILAWLSATWNEFWSGAKNAVAAPFRAIGSTLGGLIGIGGGPPEGGELPGRATGGPVTAGRAYMVGEEGPEPFIPSRSGWILPHGLGASLEPRTSSVAPRTVNNTVNLGAVTIQSDITAPEGSTQEQLREIRDKLVPTIRSTIQDVIDSALATFPETT